MKTCPLCGAPAEDDDVFCEADGAKLAAEGHGSTVPASPVRTSNVCGSCNRANADDGDGYCVQCGHRLDEGRATATLPLGSKIASTLGELTVVRLHGEDELIVTDPRGTERLLVFGPMDRVENEAAALASRRTDVFAPVLTRGQGILDPEAFGAFVVLGAEVGDARPIDALAGTLTVADSLSLLRLLLEAAEEMESQGFSWEPLSSDLYVKPTGRLVSVRGRGARPLLVNEPLNAKRVLEALADLLPLPGGLGTPELVRLFLPAWNSSTPRACTVRVAREEVARAEGVAQTRSTATLAELCDPGLRRNHNEDATGIAQGAIAGEPWSVLVVCDGVSSSTHAEQASSIAAKVATDTLSHFAASGDITHEGAASAVLAAIRSAHVAVCTSDIDYGDRAPPGTTIVAALVFRKRMTVGWVGDSRAYWVGGQGAELCTTDHSWVNEALARGEMTESEAMASPLAHALTRCLGPLETGEGVTRDVEPDVRTKALPGPGHIVLCTDGLWNYFPSAASVAALVRDAGASADPQAIARFLVCQALAQGGGDNVSVVVYEAK